MILDIMLPGRSGLDLCRDIREGMAVRHSAREFQLLFYFVARRATLSRDQILHEVGLPCHHYAHDGYARR